MRLPLAAKSSQQKATKWDTTSSVAQASGATIGCAWRRRNRNTAPISRLEAIRCTSKVPESISILRLGGDLFAAIEAVLLWKGFTARAGEVRHLAQPADFDFLLWVSEPSLRNAPPATNP